jgi:glycosyltransferase involved in cell wall biosynthesis
VDDSSIFHDISRSARFEVLENGSVIKSILSSLMTPLNGFVKSWIAKADEVICVSKRQAEIVRCELPKLANKVRVIYNPLPDVSLIEKYLNKPTFLYVGGDSYYKGFHIFLKATANLLHNEHGVKFLLAGNFRDKNRGIISSLNKKFGGPYKIVGWLPHKELLKLHSGVCGLIFPSILEEPLPYAVAESMLAGTIPIVSRVGGVPEIVQGTYAEKMIFTPGDIDELVDRIEEALSLSKDQLTDIGASLRESILRKFDTEDIKRRLLDVFT